MCRSRRLLAQVLMDVDVRAAEDILELTEAHLDLCVSIFQEESKQAPTPPQRKTARKRVETIKECICKYSYTLITPGSP